MSRFPLTFALGASATFFTLSVITLAASILPAVQWGVATDETVVPEPKEDRTARVRKRPRRTVTSESRVASTSVSSNRPWT